MQGFKVMVRNSEVWCGTLWYLMACIARVLGGTVMCYSMNNFGLVWCGRFVMVGMVR